MAAAAAAAIASIDEAQVEAEMARVPHTGSLEAEALGLSGGGVFLKRQTSHKVGEGPPPRPAIIAFKVMQRCINARKP